MESAIEAKFREACIRCGFLQVDAAEPLVRIEEDLNIRIEHARKEQWLGDVEQLGVTPKLLKSKRSDPDQRPLPAEPLRSVQPTAELPEEFTQSTRSPRGHD